MNIILFFLMSEFLCVRIHHNKVTILAILEGICLSSGKKRYIIFFIIHLQIKSRANNYAIQYRID